MNARTAFLLSVLCLGGAQAVASFVLTPMRAELVPNRDVYGALKPGEFAGTLMLGGFRGLACDLLWMRATNAKEAGRFYESVALAGSITRIQPRFEQIWEYMAWDMAYNIAAEVDDEAGKWSWFVAGLEVNAQGCQRNPQGDRLVRHLAWMFFHKGDDFRSRIEGANWAPLLNPVLAVIAPQLRSAAVPQVADAAKLPLLTGSATVDPLPATLPPFPAQPGQGNYQIAERLYRAAIAVAQANHRKVAPWVMRMVAVAIERDGNRLRNAGRHREALLRWLACLDEWQRVIAWSGQPPSDADDRDDRETTMEIGQHNDGRLRRKAALLAEQLAADPAVGRSTADAIGALRLDDARRALATPDAWHETVARTRIRWLDER